MTNADQEVQDRALHRRLLRGGTWVVVGRFLGIGLTLVLNIVLARLLSPSDFGAFLVVLSILGFCATLGRFGLDRALVRFLSESLSRQDRGRTRRVLVIGFRLGVIGGTVSGGICALFLGFFGERLFGLSQSPFFWLIAGVGLIALALLQLMAEVFRGFHELRFASMFDAQHSGPLVNLIFIGMLIAVGREQISISWVLGLYVLSLALVFPLAVFFLLRSIRGVLTPSIVEVAAVEDGTISLRDLLTVCLPIMVSQVLSFASAQGDLWIAGACCTPDQLALFAAARRLVLTVALPLGLINLTVLSAIPELHAQGRLLKLQNILQTTATAAALPCLIIIAGLVALSGPILTAIFGPFYADAASVLGILGVGQVAFVLTGSCGNLLMMTGHHNVNLLTDLVAAILLFMLAPIAAATHGIMGLAIISAGIVVFRNVCLMLAARKLIGIWTNASLTPVIHRVVVRVSFQR